MRIRSLEMVVATAAMSIGVGEAVAASKAKVSLRFLKVSQATGTLRVTFNSDPATCAAVGRCGISGTETYSASAGADSSAFLATVRSRRKLAAVGEIDLSDGSSTASVALPGGGVACNDSQSRAPLVLVMAASGRTAAVTLSGGPTASDIFDNHCPAPRLRDLAQSLGSRPLTSLPRAELSGAAAHVRIASADPFTAAGFTGSFTADLQLTLKKMKSSSALQKLANSLVSG